MGLDRLDVLDLRNIVEARLELDGCPALLTGANGSGKTSVLEAVHLLGSGRSFRSPRLAPVIRHGADALVVHGRIRHESRPARAVGVRRSRDGSGDIRMDGERVEAASSLAQVLPVQLVNPESVALVTEGPAYRRRFLDWGTFHVEPSFQVLWQSHRRALAQRNALLRGSGGDDGEFELWERQLVAGAEAVAAARDRHLAALAERVPTLLERLGAPTVTLAHRRGWSPERRLAEVLLEQREADREVGYTRAGPQRAEMRILSGGRPAAEVLSRGQTKLVACALLLAQAHVLDEHRGRRAIYLVDDLPAELDGDNRRRLGRALAELPAQVIVTAVQSQLALPGLEERKDLKMFHVEHGRVIGR